MENHCDLKGNLTLKKMCFFLCQISRCTGVLICLFLGCGEKMLILAKDFAKRLIENTNQPNLLGAGPASAGGW